ncbi:hypothetical protein RchiOBHm_Chr6g0257611 [Rosa chinensis]|uniref:RNase H type-1 domain-containing protein n=1 Tax=Rosa chinensis TaxID=74649 RepID=A0A2P6PMG2_ROSCH|nr:hypothetical protein RchiOBHm_Chr6g0257611 [Rosa chinensis]
MAVRLRIERLAIEYDSEILVYPMQQHVDDFHPLKSIINSCLHLQASFVEYSLVHVCIDMNNVADILPNCCLDGDLGVHSMA